MRVADGGPSDAVALFFCLADGRTGAAIVELLCPDGNTDFNANWPASTSAGTYVSGAYCTAGWSGTIGRQCNYDGTWSTTAVGGCSRKFGNGVCTRVRARIPGDEALAPVHR